MKPRSAQTTEVASGIPVELDVQVNGSGSIVRDGQEINQEVVLPSTAALTVGSKLLHRIDNHLYEIIKRENDVFTIRRMKDQTEHDATLRQLKSCTLIVKERRSQRTG